MKAYGVFDGGGVKGAALAGALAAAEDQGIEFVGFGGTSAGSMVAFLAAVGYSGKELGKLLVDQEFSDLLDDGGRTLREIRAKLDKVVEGLGGSYLDKARAARAIRGILNRLEKHGLYEGEKLRRFLLEQVKAKLPSLRDHADISFEDLARAQCRSLKVLASDVTDCRSAIFSREDSLYGGSAIDAVRASAGYPFAFRPMERNGYRLIDGGLASNLPSFLFEREYRASRLPTIAFDLFVPRGKEPIPYLLIDYLRALLETALEAGDELLRGMSDGVVHVPIKVPEDVSTLDFWISKATRKKLYDSGYQEAASFLTGYRPLKIAKAAGNELKLQLMVRYGELKLYQPVLSALARDVQSFSQAKNVRAHIMLPTGRRTLIVVYQFGMDGAPDSSLELPEEAGSSGQAWSTGKMIVADLAHATRAPESLKMSADDSSRIPKSRRSMLSAPIPGIPRGLVDRESSTEYPPVGVLSIDSTTRLEDTGWAAGHLVDERIQQVMTSWAYVISRMLP